jgi:hypothetical protein
MVTTLTVLLQTAGELNVILLTRWENKSQHPNPDVSTHSEGFTLKHIGATDGGKVLPLNVIDTIGDCSHESSKGDAAHLFCRHCPGGK